MHILFQCHGWGITYGFAPHSISIYVFTFHDSLKVPSQMIVRLCSNPMPGCASFNTFQKKSHNNAPYSLVFRLSETARTSSSWVVVGGTFRYRRYRWAAYKEDSRCHQVSQGVSLRVAVSMYPTRELQCDSCWWSWGKVNLNEWINLYSKSIEMRQCIDCLPIVIWKNVHSQRNNILLSDWQVTDGPAMVSQRWLQDCPLWGHSDCSSCSKLQ